MLSIFLFVDHYHRWIATNYVEASSKIKDVILQELSPRIYEKKIDVGNAQTFMQA